MKSIIAVLLLALASTASFAGKVHPQPLRPVQSEEVQPDPDLTDADIKNQVHAYLGSIDTPITPERWKALGPRAEVALLEELNGPALPTHRARAIDGLTAIHTTRTDLLKTLAANEQEHYVVRYAAMRGLGYLLPKSQAIAELQPLLEKSKDQRVRAAAGAVLAQSAPESCPAVRAQINREEANVRLRYSRAMDACFGQP